LIQVAVSSLPGDSPLKTLFVLLAPYVTVSGVVVVGWLTVRQRRRADMKAEWGRRVTWAMDHAMADDEERSATGYAVLDYLAESEIIQEDDRQMLWKFAEARIVEIAGTGAVDVPFEVEEEGSDDERD